MKLREIEVSSSRDENLTAHALKFQQSSTLAVHEDYTLQRATDNGRIFYGVFHDGMLIAYMSVIEDGHGVGLPSIGLTATARNYRNRGWMRFIINNFVKHDGPLLSDVSQTPEAQLMWKKLITNPQGLKIAQYDLATGNKNPIIRGVDPWDGTDQCCIIAEHNEPYQIRRARALKIYESIGRTIVSWYGEPHPENP